MLKKISATHQNGRTYHFSFVKASVKDILTISLSGFREVYQTLDREFAALGSNEANRFYYIFNEPELGLVRIKVCDQSEEGINLDIQYLDALPSESDGSDIFITTK